MDQATEERLLRTVSALEVLVALLAKEAKARNPNIGVDVMTMLSNTRVADAQFDKSVKDTVHRLLSA